MCKQCTTISPQTYPNSYAVNNCNNNNTCSNGFKVAIDINRNY